MIVLVVTACPSGLRGQLTRWLLEIAPGVFVGRVSKRVRDLLWQRVLELARNGRAIMVFSARNEQRLDFRVHDSDWVPVDFDGVHLMRRPSVEASSSARRQGISQGAEWDDRHPNRDPLAGEGSLGGVDLKPPATGWSSAARRRKAGRIRAARLRGPVDGEER